MRRLWLGGATTKRLKNGETPKIRKGHDPLVRARAIDTNGRSTRPTRAKSTWLELITGTPCAAEGGSPKG
jgi:hypothetical protein